jgi:hypothetical protein
MNHDAMLLEVTKFANDNFSYDEDATTPQLTIHQQLLLELNEQVPIDTTQTHELLIPSLHFLDDITLGRTYVSPQLIDSGFITEDVEHDIEIWNSATQTKTITNITKNNTLGTLLEHDPTPIEILPESEEIHKLTVFQDGPPFQDSRFLYTIDGEQFIVVVTGQRIEPFLYEPDWAQAYKVNYLFNTAISRSKKFVEQRRPLLETMRREIEAGFWEQSTVMQRVHNELKRFNSVAIGIPIFNEIMTFSADPATQLFADFRQDLVKFFNLNNLAKFILIKDLDNIDNHEVKEIVNISHANNRITFTNEVKNSYTAARTVVYPIFIGQIETFQPEYITDQHAKFSLKFKEVF